MTAVTKADVELAKRILKGISAQYDLTPNVARVLVTHLQWQIVAGLSPEEVLMLEEVNVRGWGF